ncbi:MAG: formate dehydrogenase accessory sulfurtransferase FdhD [Desulfobacteraceae bacterium]|nr:MAG: formate dehydrogenase accessory sulfurtransferase FdhD [Desulfobacteraceae bacterium]
MSPGKNTKFYQALRCERGKFQDTSLELIGEEPFLIRVNDKPYSVVMRTPGDEAAHAVGFCLAEGIVDAYEDIRTIGYDSNLDPNVIDIWLTPQRNESVQNVLERRGFVSQTSCGICGKELIKDLEQILKPAEDNFHIEINRVFDCINKLSENQNYYQTTKGSHAAIMFDEHLKMIAFAEDVGRHNALDKAIGKSFVNQTLKQASVLVLSSRISYELVQKAARAGIPVMISHSRPTALAAEMGRSLNMTLACPSGDAELLVVSSPDRIVKQKFD